MSETTIEIHERISVLLLDTTDVNTLNKVESLLQSSNKKFSKIKQYSQCGGNVGELFAIFDDCMIYSPTILKDLIKKVNYSEYYRLANKAKARLNNENVDIGRKSLYFKLGLVLRRLNSEGKLPFIDEEGNPIAITSRNCQIDDPVSRIHELMTQ